MIDPKELRRGVGPWTICEVRPPGGYTTMELIEALKRIAIRGSGTITLDDAEAEWLVRLVDKRFKLR